MSRAHRLTTRELAAWWRARRVPVLYPLDLTDQPAYELPVPDEVPALAALRTVAADPRLSVFVLHVSPHATLRSAVAVAGGDEAVLVSVTGDAAEVSCIGYSDTVRSLGGLLPDLPALDIAQTELTETDWSGLVALLSSDADEGALRSRFHARSVPTRLADAMLAGAAEPRTVGTVGVQVFTDGMAHLGPSLLSWQELPGGALLTHLHAPRRPGPVSVELGPYRTETVLRGLTEAVSTALYRFRDRP